MDGTVTAGVIIGVVLLLIAAAGLVVLIRRKGKNHQTSDKERSDLNDMYGTYEVSADPVAEVAPSNITFKSLI